VNSDVWRGFGERVLTRFLRGQRVAITAACAAAWLTLLHVAGSPHFVRGSVTVERRNGWMRQTDVMM
jgi:hypothetical protein